MKYTKGFFFFAIALVAVVSASAETIKVGTLNTYLLFKPGIAHSGRVAAEKPLTENTYESKIENLSSLVTGCAFVGLQEVGGETEVADLARSAGYDTAFAKGRDTATGEEVGAIYHLPGWRVTNRGRVPELDAVLSKHLLVSATRNNLKVYFLVVHLIRPIGANEAKHHNQIASVHNWALGVTQRDPKTIIVILGDMNDSSVERGTSLFAAGKEAGELLDFAPTHLTGKAFDRIVLIGAAKWLNAAVVVPPYGKRPNDSLKRVWTDHFFLKAELEDSSAP